MQGWLHFVWGSRKFLETPRLIHQVYCNEDCWLPGDTSYTYSSAVADKVNCNNKMVLWYGYVNEWKRNAHESKSQNITVLVVVLLMLALAVPTSVGLLSSMAPPIESNPSCHYVYKRMSQVTNKIANRLSVPAILNLQQGRDAGVIQSSRVESWSAMACGW